MFRSDLFIDDDIHWNYVMHISYDDVSFVLLPHTDA
jgi:hypothetical protein